MDIQTLHTLLFCLMHWWLMGLKEQLQSVKIKPNPDLEDNTNQKTTNNYSILYYLFSYISFLEM